jgi:hypothetical protein
MPKANCTSSAAVMSSKKGGRSPYAFISLVVEKQERRELEGVGPSGGEEGR